MVEADSPALEPCVDCGAPSDTTTYAGHVRNPDGFERRDLAACWACARRNEEELEEVRGS